MQEFSVFKAVNVCFNFQWKFGCGAIFQKPEFRCYDIRFSYERVRGIWLARAYQESTRADQAEDDAGSSPTYDYSSSRPLLLVPNASSTHLPEKN
jgi:hypothetical protein